MRRYSSVGVMLLCGAIAFSGCFESSVTPVTSEEDKNMDDTEKAIPDKMVAKTTKPTAVPTPAEDPSGTTTEDEAGASTGVEMTEAEWKAKLTPAEYHVLREKGTEPAFTGNFWSSKKKGTYVCAGCGHELFESATKFDSGTGWPSFWEPAGKGSVRVEEDSSFGWSRVEALCARCGGHLGHVFDDGPAPSGLRYCINSVSLDLEESGDGGSGSGPSE